MGAAAGRPLRVAIVGSGPAGFYAARRLLGSTAPAVEVDMFERLATPWGLVRAGVAPDHPKIKSVTHVFEKTAERSGFRFHGNVEIGADLSHDALASAYHAVLYAIGAPTGSKLGIPGEELPGAHVAGELVAWYNGHPDCADREFDLGPRRAVVIGNGNVALDVARVLAIAPVELEKTDIADHALRALERSRVEEIVVLGRRGPAQAAYTTPELRELGELAGCDVVVDPAEAALDERSRASIESGAAGLAARRNVELVAGYARRRPSGGRKRIVLRFLASPREILGGERVEAVRIVRNELADAGEGRLVARPTGAEEVIEAGLVLQCVGYRGTPISGVPFDERRATFHNSRGRVTRSDGGEPVPGIYVAGWIKRGPSGVIGTNKRCAQETVDLLLADAVSGRLPEPTREPAELLDGLAGRVDYAGWEAIDRHERAAGDARGRPRVKLVRHEQLLATARAR